MNSLTEVFSNQALVGSITAWLIAQILKVIIVFIKHGRLDFARLIGSGGMPSSHTAFVVTLAGIVGYINGFGSVGFAICFVLACITMYDAAGVRRAAGKQAEMLNKLIYEHYSPDEFNQKLKELLGHTPLEVFAGAVLGIVVAIVFCLYF